MANQLDIDQPLLSEEERQRKGLEQQIELTSPLELELKNRLRSQTELSERAIDEQVRTSLESQGLARQKQADILAGRLAGRGVERSSLAGEAFGEQALMAQEEEAQIRELGAGAKEDIRLREEKTLEALEQRDIARKEEETLSTFVQTQRLRFQEEESKMRLDLQSKLDELGLKEQEAVAYRGIFENLLTGIGSIIGSQISTGSQVAARTTAKPPKLVF